MFRLPSHGRCSVGHGVESFFLEEEDGQLEDLDGLDEAGDVGIGVRRLDLSAPTVFQILLRPVSLTVTVLGRESESQFYNSVFTLSNQSYLILHDLY